MNSGISGPLPKFVCEGCRSIDTVATMTEDALVHRPAQILLASFMIACRCLAQSVPPTTAKALDGTTIAFPRPEVHKPLLLLVGFSHKSSEDLKRWNRQMLSPYLSDPRIDYYELADLQGVPSFIERMILHGMRREIQGTEQSHFAPFTANEEEWKRAVGYVPSQNTYIVLADASGRIVWQTHGLPDEGKMSGLKAALAGVLAHP